MHERIEENKDLEGQVLTKETEIFLDKLTAEERMLIVLQAELYDGSWPAMLADLRNRLEGKPYIFKLANRIKDDIDRIEKLQNFENNHNIKLSDYIKPPDTAD